ncbi:hypothetical protein MBH78_19705 [Oceanimonas sp. NS1]|nr:hypothetical protein [Oceanimonas sp. NS1]
MLIVLINLAIFVLLMLVLGKLSGRGQSLSRRVLTGLVFGVGAGFAMQVLYDADTIQRTLEWVNVVGGGYVRLLQMIVIPWCWCPFSVPYRDCITPLPSARSAC